MIKADRVEIGKDCFIADDCDISVHGVFRLGDRGYLDTCKIRGRNVIIGTDFYSDGGLDIGGGGSNWPDAVLSIGDRCTIHNSHININQPVLIGNDVGFSPDVDIVTHGYWLSVLDGFPAKYGSVAISDGVIIGRRSIVLMGVVIGRNCVVGAQSVVTKDLPENHICAGSPCKPIKPIVPMNPSNRKYAVNDILGKYDRVAAYHSIKPEITYDFPLVYVNKAWFNVLDFTYGGTEDEQTDDFRDFMRHYGIRLYTNRPFRSVWKW